MYFSEKKKKCVAACGYQIGREAVNNMATTKTRRIDSFFILLLLTAPILFSTLPSLVFSYVAGKLNDKLAPILGTAESFLKGSLLLYY